MKNNYKEEINQYVQEKYEIFEKIGKIGSSTVYKAYDKKNSRDCAIKKIEDVMSSDYECRRLYNEIRILEHFKDHPNIIKLYNIMNLNKNIYMIYEYMEANLYDVIRANILTEQHIKFITYQLLKAIKYIHSADIVNRDLRTSHILINYDCIVKLDNFSLARSVNSNEDTNQITDYMATRWYRAPEMLLGAPGYDKSVDMWSLGCILGEMINSKILFPGSSTLTQLSLIVHVIGFPSEEDLNEMEGTLTGLLENVKMKNKKKFSSFFGNANRESVDLLKKLLNFNPKNRITVEDALEHPYLKEFRSPDEELVCETTISLELSDDLRNEVSEFKKNSAR